MPSGMILTNLSVCSRHFHTSTTDLSPVGDSDLVQEGLFSVDKECVRDPDFSQECPVESQLVQTPRTVAQPPVQPALPEVAVQRVHLVHLIHGAHRPDVEIDVDQDGPVPVTDRPDPPVVSGFK